MTAYTASTWWCIEHAVEVAVPSTHDATHHLILAYKGLQ